MATPRRILQVITPSQMSGAETQLARMTRRMEARGHTMPVVIKRGTAATQGIREHGVSIDEAPLSGKLNARAMMAILRAVKQHRPQIVQSTLSTASWWSGWLETFSDLPTIGHVQGFTHAAWHRRQTHLLAVSNAVKQHLVAQGLSADRITVLRNALEPEDFVPKRDPRRVRVEFGADADTPVIGAFGHLSVKKGYRDLFSAMPEVVRRFPKVQFWIVGRGKLRDELEERARACGCLANVRFTGFRRDTADLMNAVDIMALPSHREPCALVYVEAAVLGKPVVACHAGGSVESVADGVTGLLVPVGDEGAIADAIGELLDHRDYAAALGAAGRQRARELFSWNQFITKLEGVYEQVLDSRAQRRAA